MRNLHFSAQNNYLIFHTGNDQELKGLILQMMLECVNRYQEYEAILNAYFSIFFGKLLRYYENTAEISDTDAQKSRLSYEISLAGSDAFPSGLTFQDERLLEKSIYDD